VQSFRSSTIHRIESFAYAFVEDRPGHDRRYAIDSSKIEEEFNWHPKIRFEDGLKDSIAWYRRNDAWVSRVRSGEYLSYYDRMYKKRQQTLTER
ncbi:MAG: GDP-mannose 4,6-dehydratase, partial [Acidobacteriota bacterium]